MGQIIQPTSSSSGSSWQARPFFVIDILRQYGFRGFVAMVLAAFIAFIPLALLIWFNVFRLTSVIASQVASPVVVRPGEFQSESQNNRPGKTALLQIAVEVPTTNGWEELLNDRDPAQKGRDPWGARFVRRERVYLRKSGGMQLPYGLLGRPPVSVWLPAGEYDLAVVHETPPNPNEFDSPVTGFPLVTVFDSCTVRSGEKTIRRIQLPHYGLGENTSIRVSGAVDDRGRQPSPNLKPLAQALRQLIPIPTPGGYLISFPEPTLYHSEEHRGCTVDFEDLQPVSREWTREQLAIVRNWLRKNQLPENEILWPLVQSLLRREMCEGWFLYTLAGFAGLILTKWGSLAILEPFHRRGLRGKTLKLCFWIFLLSAVGWWFAGNP
jgi:hypothetical protein